ncbi:MAG: recombinase XerD, partial [Rikenellaceae bacterium]
AKMMTHTHVGTTEIYAKIVNETKVESANLISLK